MHSTVSTQTSGTHMHCSGDQWKPRMHNTVSTHGTVGPHSCCEQVPSGGVQMPQLELQQTSPLLHVVGPHGTTLGGHVITQNCGQGTSAGHVGHTIRQPRCAIAIDIRLPGTSPEGEPLLSADPQPMSCSTNAHKPSTSAARCFMSQPPKRFLSFYTGGLGVRNRNLVRGRDQID